MSPRGKSCIKRLAWLAIGFGAVLWLVYLYIDEPRPRGEPGQDADRLAREMMAAAGIEAWENTGAVRWTFRGKNRHLWDRQRHLVRVSWDEVVVLVDLHRRKGRAFRQQTEVVGKASEKLVDRAWRYWINDSFWLNPLAKLFDEGTERALVPMDNGERGLLITYGSGGVTPGDAYLWSVGDDGLPRSWKMWVSIIPLGGLSVSWDGWVTLRTGARVATVHRTPLGELVLSDVEGAASLAELVPGPDPFAPLFERP